MPGSCCVVASNLVQCFLKNGAQQLRVSPGIFTCRSHSLSCLSSYSVITALLFNLFDMSQTYATVLTHDSCVILHATSSPFPHLHCASQFTLWIIKSRTATVTSRRCTCAEVLAIAVRLYMAHCSPDLSTSSAHVPSMFQIKTNKVEP